MPTLFPVKINPGYEPTEAQPHALRVRREAGVCLGKTRSCYNGAHGRWISRDPIAEKGGINLYGYVGNRPINRNDPKGLKENPLTQWTPKPCSTPMQTQFIQVRLSASWPWNTPHVDNGNLSIPSLNNKTPYYPNGSYLEPSDPTSPMTGSFFDQPSQGYSSVFEVCRVCVCPSSGERRIGPCVQWTTNGGAQNLANLPSTPGPSPQFLKTLTSDGY